MSSNPFHVLVVGGGMGGLCLAQGLKKAGISVAVYERDQHSTSRLQGYRIHINPHGDEALQYCLPPELYKVFESTCGRGGDTFAFYSETMEELLSLEPTVDEEVDQVYSHRSVSRITLRKILLEGLEEEVHFDKKFLRYEKLENGRVKAFFEDGTVAYGDILVGADGGNSRVRKQFLPHAERMDTGIVAIAGKTPLTPETEELIPADTFSVMAPKGIGGFIAVQQFQDMQDERFEIVSDNNVMDQGILFDNTTSYIMWTVVAKKEKYPVPMKSSMNGRNLRDIAFRMMEGWDDRFHELVRLSDEKATSLIVFRSATQIDHWKSDRITLVGDSIHSMTPMRGIGGNTALRDAHGLCLQLIEAKQGKAIKKAIHDYESEMIEYGFAAVRSSLEAAKQATKESRVGLAMMKAAFKTINSIKLLKRKMFKNFGNE